MKLFVVVISLVLSTVSFAQSKDSVEINSVLTSIRSELIQLSSSHAELNILNFIQSKVSAENFSIVLPLQDLINVLEESRFGAEYKYYHDFSEIENDPDAVVLKNKFEKLAIVLVQLKSVQNAVVNK